MVQQCDTPSQLSPLEQASEQRDQPASQQPCTDSSVHSSNNGEAIAHTNASTNQTSLHKKRATPYDEEYTGGDLHQHKKRRFVSSSAARSHSMVMIEAKKQKKKS